MARGPHTVYTLAALNTQIFAPVCVSMCVYRCVDIIDLPFVTKGCKACQVDELITWTQ